MLRYRHTLSCTGSPVRGIAAAGACGAARRGVGRVEQLGPGSDLDAHALTDRNHVPCHRHRPGEGRVIRNEVDGLDDASVRNDVHEPCFDDVRIVCCLTASV